MLDPESGKWSGPEVAITALPGKDHSQHRHFNGTLYPHFSVRAKDWRYSLTSDGQEELYRYSTDPYEFKNLADSAEFEDIKTKLRKQLIGLRDGDKWQEHETLPTDELVQFELVAEVKGTATFRLGDTIVGHVETADWTPVRIRVAGNRNQVWLDNHVHSDEMRKADFTVGVLKSNAREVRGIRIRKL